MIKFAKSMYSTFENTKLRLKPMRRDSVFAVTPEIETSKVYQDGVATKNFIPVTIKNNFELSKVVNLSDAIRTEFNKGITPVPEVKKPEPPKEIPKPVVAPVPKEIPKVEEPKEPVLAFTEIGVKAALPLIEKETDIKKLKLALKLDERVTIRKAVEKRIEELNA